MGGSATLPWSPWILSTGGEPRPFPWSKDPRRLPFWLVVVLLSGEEEIHGTREILRVRAGQAYAIPPGQEHRLLSRAGSHPVWFHLELIWHQDRGRDGHDRLPSPTLRGAAKPGQPGWEAFGDDAPGMLAPAATGRRLAGLASRLSRTWMAGDRGSRLACSWELAAILATWRERHSRAGTLLAPAEALIRRDPAAPRSLAALARACGLGRSRFCEEWQRSHGVPPAAWMRRQRLRHAAELLDGTDMTVAAIAHHAGFAEPSAFIRAFRRWQGVSPGSWRARKPVAGSQS